MSLWDKKFKQLLETSAENTALKNRVATLEEQMSKLMTAVSSVQRTCIDLTKITVDTRRNLEDVLTYLTTQEASAQDPLAPEEGDEELSSEEMNERKRMLN